jgi:hypothetical protein
MTTTTTSTRSLRRAWHADWHWMELLSCPPTSAHYSRRVCGRSTTTTTSTLSCPRPWSAPSALPSTPKLLRPTQSPSRTARPCAARTLSCGTRPWCARWRPTSRTARGNSSSCRTGARPLAPSGSSRSSATTTAPLSATRPASSPKASVSVPASILTRRSPDHQVGCPSCHPRARRAREPRAGVHRHQQHLPQRRAARRRRVHAAA